MDIPQIGDEALDALLAQDRGLGGDCRPAGSAAQQAVVFRKLAATAGGGGKVAAYCASAPRPGAGAHGKSASHATGRATSRPGHTPVGKHKGKAALR